VFKIIGMVCDQNPFFWILKHTIAHCVLLCFCVVM
jgi:hypothetical protein